MKTIIYIMDKQQGPTVQHRKLYSISCDNPQWKRIWKNVYVYITDHFAVQQKLTQHCKATILQ